MEQQYNCDLDVVSDISQDFVMVADIEKHDVGTWAAANAMGMTVDCRPFKHCTMVASEDRGGVHSDRYCPTTWRQHFQTSAAAEFIHRFGPE